MSELEYAKKDLSDALFALGTRDRELAALREELAIIRPERDLYKASSEALEDQWHASEQRLADAERRNAAFVELLNGLCDAGDWYTSALEFNRDQCGHEWLAKIEAALTKPEEAKS